MRKTADELASAVQGQTEKTLSACREEADSIREACQEQTSHIDDVLKAEAESIRVVCQEQAAHISEALREEAALAHKNSGELNEQLASLQEQIGRMEASVQKLSAMEAVIHRRSDRPERCINHCIPRAELSFEIALAEHCDLNCAGCDHFSPLAEPEISDPEEAARDFVRLGELFHGHAREIHLLGGEPLLHPEIIKFAEAARASFPDADIDITTNGVRLLNQPDAFWKACHDNRVLVRPTKYSIPMDFEAIEERAAEHDVMFRYYNPTGASVKMTNLYRLDIDGLQDGTRNYLLCHRANTCVYLQHGRLYTCSLAPTARHFSKYFGKQLREYPEDSIDIYKAGSAREIMEFLAKPIPFCRYCMIEKTRWDQPWHQSERKIEEWT